MKLRFLHQAMFSAMLLFQFSICLGTEIPDANESSKYLDAVREFADNVLKYGRDVYGPKHTPLFVDGLNIHTHEPVKWKHKGEVWYLSNLASQQNLFRVLDGLTTLTGDPKYRQAAMDAIEYAFKNLRSPNGLLYWGGHSAYDALADQPRIPNPWGSNEFKCHFPYYELMWEVDPKATKRFIEAFWSAHILDWSNLDMNRHGSIESQMNEPWNHKYEGGPVFFKSKLRWGRAFLPTGASLMQAGTSLYKLSDEEQPFLWSRRLAKRYVDTRHPKTGISYEVYNMRWPEMGDDLREHFRDPYTTYFPFGSFAVGPKVYPPENTQPYPWMSLLLMGEMLGVKGNMFIQWAGEELTAWGKASYRSEDNVFIPILTDGTSLEGYVWKEAPGSGAAGFMVKPQPVGFSLLWAYSMAYRLTDDSFMWKMVHNIVLGNGFGDIGNIPEIEDSKLAAKTSCSDPRALLSFMELYKKTKSQNFLAMAQCIGENIITRHLYKGFFVASREHLFTRFNTYEALALLHLHAATNDDAKIIPCVWPGTPSFGFPYRDKEEGVDYEVIYALTKSPEVPVSLQEAAFAGDVKLLRTLISNDENVNGLDDSLGSTALRRAAIAGHKDVAELLISKGADINAGTPIQRAVEHGHKDFVELLIAKGADIDVKNETGSTLLHLAAQGGHEDIVELLIKKGADVSARNNYGQTPIHLAVQRGQQDVVKLLLKKEADVNAKDNDGNTLLQHALQQRRWSIAKDLIDAGVEVNATNNSGKYPLHLAARRGRNDLIEQLLDKGADVNAKDKEGDTALSMAAQGDHLKTMELLISRGADIHIKDNKGKFLADQCLGSGRKSIVDMLIAKGANTSTVIMAAYMGNLAKVKQYLQTGPKQDVLEEKGFYLLMAATTGGRTDVAIYLLDQGVKATYAENENITALHVASNVGNNAMIELLVARGAGLHAGNKWTPLEGAVWSKHKDAVRFLISKGANINHGPETALHRAVSWWSMEPAKRLLELGADINAKDENGNTPLHEAVDTWWPEVAEVLLSQGAKIDLKNNQDQTPLLMASDVGFYKMTRLLIDKGADIHAKDKQGRTALDCALQNGNKQIAQLLESEGAKPSDGRNMLHRAAAGDNFREFKALLTQTLDISLRDAQDRNGFTPLHCAILFWRTDNAKLLIDKGAGLNVQDNDGYTPLHYVAWQGMKGMAELLIDRNAKLNIQDNWGWTPLHRAVIAKQADIAKILIDKGVDINIKDKEGRTALWWAEDLGLEDTAELLKQTNQKEAEATDKSTRSPEGPVAAGQESQHDIAITDASIPKDYNQGEIVPVTVSIANQGTQRETFRITLTDDVTGEEIASQEMTLSKGWKDGSEDIADVVFNGEDKGIQEFGGGIQFRGDINGDGFDDILICAPRWNSSRGRVYLYYGGSSIDPSCPDVTFSGEDPNTNLGDYAGISGCDIDMDGYDDVIMGAWGYNNYDGRVYVYYGGPTMDTQADMVFDGKIGKEGWFGLAVASADIDDDGYEDILVSAQNYDQGRGRVYVFWGGETR